MAQVSYNFLKSNPGIILRTLEFQGHGDDITGVSGTVTRSIPNLLNINVYAEGSPSAIGSTWRLIVKVNNKPIQTEDGTGVIRGTIQANGKSKHFKDHDWYT